MNITVNLPGANTITLEVDQQRNSMTETIKAIKLLYPNWTSMVITVVNRGALADANTQ